MHLKSPFFLTNILLYLYICVPIGLPLIRHCQCHTKRLSRKAICLSYRLIVKTTLQKYGNSIKEMMLEHEYPSFVDSNYYTRYLQWKSLEINTRVSWDHVILWHVCHAHHVKIFGLFNFIYQWVPEIMKFLKFSLVFSF